MAAQNPALRANAGTVTAAITVRRPSWRDIERNYPAEAIKSTDFYPMVSKAYATAATQPRTRGDYENTCAARMSYTLNRSGLLLPVAPDGGNLKGDDGYNYWLRVGQLSLKLKKHFGNPDRELVHPSLNESPSSALLKDRVSRARVFLSELAPLKGIVVFEVTGWGNATGHFTLWDGTNLAYVGEGQHNDPTSLEYYFWFFRTDAQGRVFQTNRVIFWELK